MEEKVHVFKDSLVIGDAGESIVYNYLQSLPTVSSVLDVSNSRMYQEVDVDFLAKMTTGDELKIEVKTDTYRSGNIYYETVSAEEVNSIGGFQKTTCDFMFYYFINMDTLYILKMDEYREWFNKHEEEFIQKGYQKRPVNRRWNGSTYTSVGYAFPIHLIEDKNNTWWSKFYLNKNDWQNT